MLIPGGRDIRVRKNVLRVTALLPFTKGVPLFSEYIRPTSHTRLSVLPKKYYNYTRTGIVKASGLLQAKVLGRVYLDHPPPLFSTGACITLALLALLGVVCA